MQCIKCVFPVFSTISQRIRSNRRAGVLRRVKEACAHGCPLKPFTAEIVNECNYTPRTSAWHVQGFTFVGSFAVTKIAYYLSHVRPSVSICPSVLHVSAWLPAERISVKFDTGDIHWNLQRKSKYGSNRAKMSGTLYEDRLTFYCCQRHYTDTKGSLRLKWYQAAISSV